MTILRMEARKHFGYFLYLREHYVICYLDVIKLHKKKDQTYQIKIMKMPFFSPCNMACRIQGSDPSKTLSLASNYGTGSYKLQLHQNSLRLCWSPLADYSDLHQPILFSLCLGSGNDLLQPNCSPHQPFLQALC